MAHDDQSKKIPECIPMHTRKKTQPILVLPVGGTCESQKEKKKTKQQQKTHKKQSTTCITIWQICDQQSSLDLHQTQMYETN